MSNVYKMLQTSWAGFQKTQSTIITCLKCRKETLWIQMLLLLYLAVHLPPYHLIFWCQDLRVNPRWPSLTVMSDFMLAPFPSHDVLNSLLKQLLTFARLLQASLVFWSRSPRKTLCKFSLCNRCKKLLMPKQQSTQLLWTNIFFLHSWLSFSHRCCFSCQV